MERQVRGSEGLSRGQIQRIVRTHAGWSVWRRRQPTQPNALWCADYKDEFMLGNRRCCYPPTVADFASRYLLTCEALTTQEKFALTVLERTFTELGQVIRTHNGVPFASAHATYGLASWPLTRDNTDRRHQALGMQVPADLCARSARVYRGLEDLTYPFRDQMIMVTGRGRICFRGRNVSLSHVFSRQRVGVTQVGEHICLVTSTMRRVG